MIAYIESPRNNSVCYNPGINIRFAVQIVQNFDILFIFIVSFRTTLQRLMICISLHLAMKNYYRRYSSLMISYILLFWNYFTKKLHQTACPYYRIRSVQILLNRITSSIFIVLERIIVS